MDINFLFIIVVVIFLRFMIKGYKKGFLRILVSLIGVLTVMAGAIVISPVIASNLSRDSYIYEKIENKIIESFNHKAKEADNSYEVFGNDLYENNDRTLLDDLMDEYNMPQILKSDFIEKYSIRIYQGIAKTVFEKYLAGYIANLIIRSKVFIMVTAILYIIVWLLLRTTDLIAKLPIIKGFNRILGCITGLVEALFIVWMIFFVIIVFMGNGIGEEMIKSVKESSFLTFLFNNNLILKLIW
ncbi:MAG: CvpA family protein [Lachnospiraceae bacterium]|nr:CvpA family protein [Lachnospiraceae bacterium]